jgi:hypothetical protein
MNASHQSLDHYGAITKNCIDIHPGFVRVISGVQSFAVRIVAHQLLPSRHCHPTADRSYHFVHEQFFLCLDYITKHHHHSLLVGSSLHKALATFHPRNLLSSAACYDYARRFKCQTQLLDNCRNYNCRCTYHHILVLTEVYTIHLSSC